MKKRFVRVFGVLVSGCAFQLAGCESQQVADILAQHVRNATVEVGTFVLESVVDNTLGLQ